jgi:integrase
MTAGCAWPRRATGQAATWNNLATLQALMGHRKKETTLKYIHLTRTNLRKERVETAL